MFAIIQRYQSDEIDMATHTGTHLDAPIHFARKRWTVAQIPLQNLIERPLAIIDVVQQSEATRDYRATLEDIQNYESNNGQIHEESVVIFRTGWSKFWPNKLDYFGTDTKDESQAHFPGLETRAARWLIKERKVVGVGIDGPSIDCGQCSLKSAHVTLCDSNVYILENIDRSIFKVPVAGATLTVLPLKLADASGAPARVIAQFTHDHAEANPASEARPLLGWFAFLLLACTMNLLH